MTTIDDTAECSIDGCDSPVRTRGWCGRHYARFLRWGDPLTTKRQAPNPNPPATCTLDGCDRKHLSLGLCAMHYHRQHRGNPLGPNEPQRNPGALCGVSDCNRPSRMWGYCTMHGHRYDSHGDPEALGWGTLRDDTPTSLYRLWGHSGELLYIGVTVDVRRRLVQHSKCQPWWDDVARYGVKVYESRPEAFNAERIAVAVEQPQHNVKLRRSA